MKRSTIQEILEVPEILPEEILFWIERYINPADRELTQMLEDRWSADVEGMEV